jgi:cytochrome c oxidase cbb3-type subunit 3
LSIAIILLIVIVVFSEVVKAGAFHKIDLAKAKTPTPTTTTVSAVVAVLLLASNTLFAQTTEAVVAVAPEQAGVGGINSVVFYAMLITILVELFIAWKLYQLAMDLLGVNDRKEAEAKAKIEANEPSFFEKLNASVAVEEENEIMLDHDYDGIKELDNNLPPWWKYGFYATIVFAFVYLTMYHVTKTSNLQGKEYEAEMAQAKIDVEEYMKTSANNVDETTVKLLTDAPAITAGKEIFTANCVACHGNLGQGTVGPNLTDDNWIHGGSVQSIFKSVKYGWVEKGMKAWQEDLSPIQMAQVTSYIKTLRGTNPPSPKAPQGDIYTEEGATTATVSDSTATTIKTDSLTVAKK